jgi:hypothetical protein
VFSVFHELYERFFNESGEKYELEPNPDFFNKTIELLRIECLNAAELFPRYGICDFRFLSDELDTFFTQGRKDEDAALIFTTIISAEKVGLFMRCIVASAFVGLWQRLEDAEEGRLDSFVVLFKSLISSLDVRVLLDRTAEMFGRCLSREE